LESPSNSLSSNFRSKARINGRDAASSILKARGFALFAALRFIWNATRGHRLAPWRSDFLRWRVETYSGKKAETLTARSVLGFMWTERWELLRFLAWTGELEREARTK
jgi:hypothetical protein